MRDPVKLEKERKERNALILNSAYKLFVEKRIEAVSMQMVADEAGIGVATVFRYYANKQDLVMAVCMSQWYTALGSILKDSTEKYFESLSPLDRLTHILNLHIELYKEHKDLLLFNDNFIHYIIHEEIAEDKMGAYREITDPMDDRFHSIYEEAKIDKSIRTDIPEDKLKRITLNTMMSACIYYSSAVVWGNIADDIDYVAELEVVRDMIIKYITVESSFEN